MGSLRHPSAEGLNLTLLLICNGLAVPFICGSTSSNLRRPW
jgi:hypothetical protein